jgi:hypothetical protein
LLNSTSLDAQQGKSFQVQAVEMERGLAAAQSSDQKAAVRTELRD